jgi:hypothetical protein
MHIHIYLEYLKGRRRFGDLTVGGRIILKRVLNKKYVRVWTEFIWLRIRTSGSSLGT